MKNNTDHSLFHYSGKVTVAQMRGLASFQPACQLQSILTSSVLILQIEQSDFENQNSFYSSKISLKHNSKFLKLFLPFSLQFLDLAY